MTIGKQSLRRKRDFYDFFRPNTALWIGRWVAVLPAIILAGYYVSSVVGMPSQLDGVGRLISPLLVTIIVVCWLLAPTLRGGIWQLSKRSALDEFEWSRIERARLFAYRALTILLIVIFIASPFIHGFVEGITDAANGEPNRVDAGYSHSAESAQLYDDAITWLLLCAFTLAPAHYHWSLKRVSAEENIRPNLPSKSDATEKFPGKTV